MRVLCCQLLCIAVLLGAGCRLPQWPRRKEVAVLPPNATKEQIIAHLNQNILGTDQRSGLVSWQATNARASSSGIGFTAPATIFVEAPRNFRILISQPVSGSQMADFGSNSQICWSWDKMMGDTPPILTVNHQDVDVTMQEFPEYLPLHPDLVMEVFGVIPIDPHEYELVSSGELATPIATLKARRTSPSGITTERIIRVDTMRGQIIRHELRDAHGSPIAWAELDNYRLDKSGISMPRLVRFSMTGIGQEFKLDLGTTEVNPPGLADNADLWNPPQIRGAETVNLGMHARQQYSLGNGPIEMTGAVSLPDSQPVLNPKPPTAEANPWGSIEENRPSTQVPTRSATWDRLDAPEPHPAVWGRPVPAEDSADKPAWAR